MMLLRWIVIALCAIGATSANAAPQRTSGISPKSKIITIRSDNGGMIAKYALAVKKAKRENGFIRFVGRCDSACTLYLALSERQACVGPSSSFGFHLPYGVAPRAAAVARDYMLKRYPGWVRKWIHSNGGLTPHIKTMPFSYARRFIPECGTGQSASVEPARPRVWLSAY